MIKINREKAEAEVLKRLRSERKPLLEKLDLEFMRALESGESAEHIAKAKQDLRDITSKTFSALSLEDLANLSVESALSI